MQILTQKKISIFTYLSMIQLPLVVFCVIMVGAVAYFQGVRQLDREMAEHLKSITQAATIMIDGDQLAALNQDDENTPYYKEIFDKLRLLKEKTGAGYIYTMRLSDGKPAYIVDADSGKNHNPIGKVYNIFEPGMKKAFDGETAINAQPTYDSDEKIWSRSGYAPIKNSAGEVIGIVGVDIKATQIQRVKDVLLFQIGLIVVISGLLAGLISLLMAHRLSRTLKILIGKLDEIASTKGDLTGRLQVETFLKEINLLANSVNRVQNNTWNTLKSISKLTAVLNIVSEKLLDSSQTVSAGSEEVSASMTEIKSGAEVQSISTANIAKLVQEISAGSAEAAQSAAEAEQVSVNSTQAAENGRITVKETLTLIIQIEQFAGKLKDLSNDLNARSEQIHRILYILNNISRQTKILALNANIEAAKAGVAGQGFAVVARQIQELAENSQHSVDDIANRVNEIRSALSETVSLIAGFYELVELGGSKIMDAEARLVEIQDSSKENLTFVNRMATLVQRQASQTKDATKTVQMIAEISEKFALSSESVVQAAEDQTQAIQEVLNAAQDIRLAINDLQKMVEESKLD